MKETTSPLLLETLKIKDGEVYNIHWHNQRCNKARKELFSSISSLDLRESLKNIPLKGLFRCRILYQDRIKKVEYIPYITQEKKEFKIIQKNINYPYKYANRICFDSIIPQYYDEVIIEKHGLLTDTSIANIAFYDKNRWITPKTPLLKGTCRERLLKKGFLKEKNIKASDIHKYRHFALMNAMIGFQIQKGFTIHQ